MNFTFTIRTRPTGGKTDIIKETYQLRIEESDAAVLQGLARLLERQSNAFAIEINENNDVIDFEDYV